MGKRILKRAAQLLEKVLGCYIFKTHDWTCAANEGIPPTPEQLHGGVTGFLEYAKTYCKRCEVESETSKEARAENGRA